MSIQFLRLWISISGKREETTIIIPTIPLIGGIPLIPTTGGIHGGGPGAPTGGILTGGSPRKTLNSKP